MKKPTASSIERALACPGSLALPGVYTSSRAAERGTAIHEYLEAVQGGADPEAALEEVPEDWRPVCAAIELDRLPQGLAAEVAFAYHLNDGTGRELGCRLGRRYEGTEEWELPGTADVVGLSEDAVYVGDYKTGWVEPTPAERNGQLLFLALAAARAYGRDAAVVEIIRIKENGTPWRDRAELDELDLDAFAAELGQLRARAAAAHEQVALVGDPDVHPGPHCKYCPAFSRCPSKRDLLIRLAAGTAFDEWKAVQPLSPAVAGAAYERFLMVRQAMKHVEAAWKEALAKYGELPLSAGRVLREVLEEGNEQLDGRVVYAVVKAQLGQEVAEAAVEIAASKASIDRALKAAAGAGIIKPRTGAAHQRAILKVVRDRKGATRPMRTKLVEMAAGAVAPLGQPQPAPELAAAPPASPAEAGPPSEEEQAAIRVREQLEVGIEAPPDMEALHKTIRAGMEREVETWSPVLKLWGRLNEELKGRAA